MEAVGEMLRTEGPVYLRLSRDAAPSLHGGRAGVRLGKANLLMDGRDVTLVSTGTMLAAAIEARALLKAQGIDAAILEAISVKPLDEEAVCRMAERTGRVVTLEEHTVNGGLGDAVCAALCRGRPTPVLKIGLEDTFGQSARSYAQLVAAYGLDGPGVARQVENFVRGH